MKYLITLLALVPLALSAAEQKPKPQPEPAAKWDAFAPNTIAVIAVGISRTTDVSKFENSLGTRLSYDLTDKLGFFGEIDGQDVHSTLIERGTVGVKLGRPIGHFRPYIAGTLGETFGDDDEQFFGGGVGVDWLPFAKRDSRASGLRVFAELGAEKGTRSDTTAKGVLGVGLSF